MICKNKRQEKGIFFKEKKQDRLLKNSAKYVIFALKISRRAI